MNIVKITENNIGDAGKIHSESWKESHKSFCSEGFVARHTEEAQTEYISKEEVLAGIRQGLIDVKESRKNGTYQKTLQEVIDEL